MSIGKAPLLALCVAALPGLAHAESELAVPTNLVRLSTDLPLLASQPQLAADPANPARIFAASDYLGAVSIAGDGGVTVGFTACYASSDYGATWQAGTFANIAIQATAQGEGAMTFGDPDAGDVALGALAGDVYTTLGYATVSVDGRHEVHLVGLAELEGDILTGPAYSRDAVVHLVSTDGLHYAPSDVLVAHNSSESQPGFEDAPWSLLNAATDTLYVAWTHFSLTGAESDIYFARLAHVSQGNVAWDPPVRLDRSGVTQTAQLALEADGSLLAVWQDFDLITGAQTYSGARSTDDGRTFSAPVEIVPSVAQFGELDTDGNQRIGPFVAAFPYGIRVSFIPSVAVDLSQGPHRGAVYLAWNAANPDDPAVDGGQSDSDVFLAQVDPTTLALASNPTRVNDDGTRTDQFNPALSVGPSGTVHVLFYDRRDDPANVKVSVTLAATTDQGATFSQAVVPATQFDPTSALEIGFDPPLGDYNALLSLAVPGASGTAELLVPAWGQLLPDAGSDAPVDLMSLAGAPVLTDAGELDGGGAPDAGADAWLDAGPDGGSETVADAGGAAEPADAGTGGGGGLSWTDAGAAPTPSSSGPAAGNGSGSGSGGEAGGAGTSGGGGGACYIATAAYGDYDHPYVRVLRAFRDFRLESAPAGRWLVRWYYENSPPAAAWIASHGWARRLEEAALLPTVAVALLVTFAGVGKTAAVAALALALAFARRRRPARSRGAPR
ncbi:MAG: CFI-box-CTERM domain-containing protein [Myxococcales bacterium]